MTDIHWTGNVILTKFSSLAVLNDVISKTSGAASDKHLIKISISVFSEIVHLLISPSWINPVIGHRYHNNVYAVHLKYPTHCSWFVTFCYGLEKVRYAARFYIHIRILVAKFKAASERFYEPTV